MFRLTEIKLPFKAYLMPLESESLGTADGQGAESLEGRPLTVTRTVTTQVDSSQERRAWSHEGRAPCMSVFFRLLKTSTDSLREVKFTVCQNIIGILAPDPACHLLQLDKQITETKHLSLGDAFPQVSFPRVRRGGALLGIHGLPLGLLQQGILAAR